MASNSYTTDSCTTFLASGAVAYCANHNEVH
jgi:hypothetical protein